MTLVVRTPEELLAAVPHMLGFKPEESLVVIPLRPGLPIARIDIPTTPRERDEVWQALGGAYRSHARRGDELAIVCVAADLHTAETISRELADKLGGLGIAIRARLWSDGPSWRELDTGERGLLTQATQERVAVAMVLDGAARPASSREAIAASMVGDRAPLAAVLPTARAAAAASTTGAERTWAQERVERFHADGNRLADVDAARMLVALETLGTRDALWVAVSRESAPSDVALWTDLTRRAPDEVRAAPAALLGFTSWLNGDGARAWCALDQVPAERPYSMAAVVASALQNAIHPDDWGRYRAQMRELASDLANDIASDLADDLAEDLNRDQVGEPDQSFVPQSAARRPDVAPARPVTHRSAPGR